jgi:hypothetical protein
MTSRPFFLLGSTAINVVDGVGLYGVVDTLTIRDECLGILERSKSDDL